MSQQDVERFVTLRQELSKVRRDLNETNAALSQVQRDYIALAQAEALCDIAATLNAGIVVSSE